MICICRKDLQYDLRYCSTNGECFQCGNQIKEFVTVRSQLALRYTQRLRILLKIKSILLKKSPEQSCELYDLMAIGALDADCVVTPPSHRNGQVDMDSFPIELLRQSIEYDRECGHQALVQSLQKLFNSVYAPQTTSRIKPKPNPKTIDMYSDEDINKLLEGLQNAIAISHDESHHHHSLYSSIRQFTDRQSFSDVFNLLLSFTDAPLKFPYLVNILGSLDEETKTDTLETVSELSLEDTISLYSLFVFLDSYPRNPAKITSDTRCLCNLSSQERKKMCVIMEGSSDPVNNARLRFFTPTTDPRTICAIWDILPLFPLNTEDLLLSSVVSTTRVLMTIGRIPNVTPNHIIVALNACSRLSSEHASDIWTRFSNHVLFYSLHPSFFMFDQSAPNPIIEISLPQGNMEGINVKMQVSESECAKYTFLEGDISGHYEEMSELDGDSVHSQGIQSSRSETYRKRVKGGEMVVERVDSTGVVTCEWWVDSAQVVRENRILNPHTHSHEVTVYERVPMYPHYYYSNHHSNVDFIHFNEFPPIIPIVQNGELVVFRQPWLQKDVLLLVPFLLEVNPQYSIPFQDRYTLMGRYTNANNEESELDLETDVRLSCSLWDLLDKVMRGLKPTVELMGFRFLHFHPKGPSVMNHLINLVIADCRSLTKIEIGDVSGNSREFCQLERLSIMDCEELESISIYPLDCLSSLNFCKLVSVTRVLYDSSTIHMEVTYDQMCTPFLQFEIQRLFGSATSNHVKMV